MRQTDKIGETRFRLSHATGNSVVIEVRRRIDERRDELKWLTIPVCQAASLVREMRDAVTFAPANDPAGKAPLEFLREPALT